MKISTCKGNIIVYLPLRTKADVTMLIVTIDSDTTSKGEISAWKGKSIIDMPFLFVVCHKFSLRVYLCLLYINCPQLPSSGISPDVFCVRVPDIIIKLNNNKNCHREKMSIRFYIPQWAVAIFRTNNMCTRRASVLRATCGIPEKINPTHLYLSYNT